MSKSIQRATARDALDRGRPGPSADSSIWDRLTGGGAVVQRDLTKPYAESVREINIKHIKPDPAQPRKSIDQEKLKELAASISEQGVLQLPTVTWSEKLNCYLLVTGERRYAASKLAGLKTLPCIIKADPKDASLRRQQQLVENIQRENLPPIDEAQALQELMDTANLSQRAVAKRLGKPQTYIAELVQILRIPDKTLPKVQDWPKQALVQLSRVKDSKEQQQLAKNGLTSGTPFKAVKTTRDKQRTSTRYEHFKETLHVEGSPFKAVITADMPPDEVTHIEVAEFVAKLANQLTNQKRHR